MSHLKKKKKQAKHQAPLLHLKRSIQRKKTYQPVKKTIPTLSGPILEPADPVPPCPKPAIPIIPPSPSPGPVHMDFSLPPASFSSPIPTPRPSLKRSRSSPTLSPPPSSNPNPFVTLPLPYPSPSAPPSPAPLNPPFANLSLFQPPAPSSSISSVTRDTPPSGVPPLLS